MQNISSAAMGTRRKATGAGKSETVHLLRRLLSERVDCSQENRQDRQEFLVVTTIFSITLVGNRTPSRAGESGHSNTRLDAQQLQWSKNGEGEEFSYLVLYRDIKIHGDGGDRLKWSTQAYWPPKIIVIALCIELEARRPRQFRSLILQSS